MRLWHPAGRQLPEQTLTLARLLSDHTPAAALAAWRPAWPEVQAVHVHGDRHDLWWEFALSASFRWQAHVYRLNPAFAAQRLDKLTKLFDLAPLLNVRVEELSPAQQARANLAVALLPQPDILLWEEPSATAQVTRALRHLCQAEGLTVLTTDLKEGLNGERRYQAWTGRAGGRTGARTAG